MSSYIAIIAGSGGVVAIGSFLIWLAFRTVTSNADKAGEAKEDNAINRTAAEKADAIAQAAASRPTDDDVSGRLRNHTL